MPVPEAAAPAASEPQALPATPDAPFATETAPPPTPATSPTGQTPPTSTGDAPPAATDPKDLDEKRRIDGLVGSRLQAERERWRTEYEAEQKAKLDAEWQANERKARREFLANLDTQLEENPLEGSETARKLVREELDRFRAEDETAATAAVRAEAAGTLFGNFHQGFSNWAVRTLGIEGVQELGRGEYPTEPVQGTLAYLDAAFQRALKVETEKAVRAERAVWEKEARPALLKEALGSVADGEPSIDTEAGRPVGGDLTLSRWLAMSGEERMRLPNEQKDRMVALAMRGTR